MLSVQWVVIPFITGITIDGTFRSLKFTSANFNEVKKEVTLAADYLGQPINKLAINYAIYHNQQALKVCVFPYTANAPNNALVGVSSINGPGG